MSKFRGVKTNNAKNKSKIQIRENVLSLFKNERNVLEVFCGDGKMYRDVWKKGDKYTGIDIVEFNDERETIQGDSKEVLNSLDIDRYNIFDIDAYGSPYEELSIILKKLDRNKYNEYAFIITDGLGIDLKMGNIAHSLRSILDIKSSKIKNAHKLHEVFIQKIVDKLIKNFNNIKETKFYHTKGITGANMRYYSIYINLQNCKD